MVERVGKSFEVWWDSIKEKPSAQKYLKYVDEFLEWKGWGYEEFFNKFFEAQRSQDPRDEALMNNQFISYFKKKRGEGFSSGYARNHVGAVIGFLSANGLTVGLTKKQQKDIAKKTLHQKDNFTKEEVNQILSATTSPRNKSLILTLKDTGMAVSDVCDLNIEDIKHAIDNNNKFTQIEYARNKTDEQGVPCLGYESLDSIRNWLRWREENGFNCNPQSPLFILTENKEKSKHSKEELQNGVRMEGQTVTAVIKYIIKRAGITDKRLSAHCLRIFNASQLESAGVNKNVVYRIQGRLIPDSGRVYSKGEVLSSYVKSYNSLVIGPQPQIIEVQDKELTEKLSKAKQEQDDRIKEQDEQIRQLKNRLEKYENSYGVMPQIESRIFADNFEVRKELELLKQQILDLQNKKKKPKKSRQKTNR